ncbi:4'-phosphopantetheinyl transferase superfamily protein [Acidithiobacillus thiooxidans]|jgi:enterobactin synthetase component D|uniref:4'-phosphopantetheinyl transferase family protein n=1 Tax=Acidithiobacillus TaxID=119977 RepID=UPI00285E3887|nr:4'-phosphopantetheinyl transferase superfamily protein [Acidithiobacillus thiooxidans]MDD5318590.1 4'-phosphopantetheinyl transferase superfamily protein [Candidatus Paceibacterota bacterium]MDD5575533.1 4'-phosphopantetheinyl transferase superfamily protein [Acidithiobacillus sp.]MDR7927093.1 4'-phosphopantetheinyl transferase superfamily protein [Acidithiobacillus thiooxidans]
MKRFQGIPSVNEEGGFIISANTLQSNPDGVFMLVSFDVSKFMDNLYQRLGISFTEEIASSVIKRRAEYLAGRYVAKLALERLGFFKCDIESDERRCPLWPIGIVGSISHAKNKALCAVWRTTHTDTIGIDIEYWIAPYICSALEAQAADRTECDLLAACGLTYHKALTLLFSAKESVFKALYPKVGYYFDFSAIRLAAIDTEAHMLIFVVNRMLGPYRKGFALSAAYKIFTGGVIVLVRIGN